MVWPTLGSRTAEEQNRKSVIDSDGMIRPRCTTLRRPTATRVTRCVVCRVCLSELSTAASVAKAAEPIAIRLVE